MCYIIDMKFLYQLAQARPHNVLHFLVYREDTAVVGRYTVRFNIQFDVCRFKIQF